MMDLGSIFSAPLQHSDLGIEVCMIVSNKWTIAIYLYYTIVFDMINADMLIR